MVSFSSYIGNGLSNLKERSKSNPRVNQNKTRMSNYGRKLCTDRMSNYRLEALCSQQGRKKKCFQFFTPPMPPTPSTPKHQPQNVGHLLLIKDIGTSRSFVLCDILNDLPFLWGRHLCTATHQFLYQKQEDCNFNGPTLSTLRDNLCIYVMIIYSLLKPAFHVKISHILLQNDLKHQFWGGGGGGGASPPNPHGDA